MLMGGTVVVSSGEVTEDASVEEAGGSVSYGIPVTGGTMDEQGSP
jgi:hypothetical protein